MSEVEKAILASSPPYSFAVDVQSLSERDDEKRCVETGPVCGLFRRSRHGVNHMIPTQPTYNGQIDHSLPWFVCIPTALTLLSRPPPATHIRRIRLVPASKNVLLLVMIRQAPAPLVPLTKMT